MNDQEEKNSPLPWGRGATAFPLKPQSWCHMKCLLPSRALCVLTATTHNVGSLYVLEVGGCLAENKGKGRGKGAQAGGIQEVGKGGKEEKNSKQQISYHEGCLQHPGQDGARLSACLGQWFSTFSPTNTYEPYQIFSSATICHHGMTLNHPGVGGGT